MNIYIQNKSIDKPERSRVISVTKQMIKADLELFNILELSNNKLLKIFSKL